MLLTLVKEHTLIVLAVTSLLVYSIGRLLHNRTSKVILGVSIIFLVLLFSFRNYPILLELLEEGIFSFLHAPILSVQKIGLSYILFRFIHWIVESYRRKINQPSFFSFLNYIFFFPTILAGPIDTYSNFQYWLGNKRSRFNRILFFAGITRILIGAFKTLAIVPLIIKVATDYTLLIPDFSPLIAVFLSSLMYSLYIFLDFSGYSDIAIGSAYLIGIKTPENFNSPYIAKNLSDFWKRWHMTFSQFLSAYVFKPSIALFNLLFGSKNRLVITILGYLTTFTICGLWHGETFNFVLWGLWHGIGLSINKIWTSKLKLKLIKTENWIYNLFSITITFTFVSIGWLFFHYQANELNEILNLFYEIN